jgi:hypothetical protein
MGFHIAPTSATFTVNAVSINAGTSTFTFQSRCNAEFPRQGFG